MDQTSPRPVRRSSRKHRAILDAAAGLVARHGYASTTIERIAGEAGVGKQTIYRWWPSKAELFVEVYMDLVSRAALAVEAPSARAALAAMLRRLFALYRETPAGRILAGLIAEATEDAAATRALQQGLVLGRADIVAEIVGRGVDRGELAVAPATVNEVIVAMVWKRLVVSPDSLDDDFAAALTAIAIAAGSEADDDDRGD